MNTQLRPELTDLPERMKHLPLDERGYPIPRFVDTLDEGKRDFRFMDRRFWVRAVKERLCWVCGGKLGAHLVFAIGPMCAITRTTSEPACHLECARWSAQNCPFMARPHMIRREDDLSRSVEENIAGQMIKRNPGATCLWITRDFKTWQDDKGGWLITVGDPESVEWWALGKPATRAEVEESIRTGLPILAATCEGDADCLVALEQKRAAVEALLPPAV